MVFSALFVVSFLLWWGPLSSVFALAIRDGEYTYILIILPISAAFVFLERKDIGTTTEPGIRIGTIVLALAALCRIAAWQSSMGLSTDARLSINMAALVVWWIAAFVFCFGLPAARRLMFPLCFLFWMVPIPAVVLNKMVEFLQQASAIVTYWFFSAAGVPVAKDGIVLSIPGLNIAVARECSSIRSSMVLLVTSMVLAQFYLRAAWRKTIVTLAAVPLSVVKNGFRIFVLSMLGTHVDPGFLVGRLHRDGGIVFFLLAIAGVFLLLRLLQWNESSRPAMVSLPEPSPTAK